MTARNEKVHLRDLSLEELYEFIVGRHGLPKYRYRQIASWMYGKLAGDFSEMTDIPLSFRQTLEQVARLSAVCVTSESVSKLDGTRKFLFELGGGDLVESVLMRHDGRITLCVSSQVGCPLDCVFCQTGKGTYGRNLSAGEILDQICCLKQQCGVDVDKVNIVFMGMGEPLLNYDAITRVIRVLNHPDGFDMGSRRITLSTSGIPRRMRALADEGLRCSLALSLNAPTDELRRKLMPALSRYSIAETLDAARYFAKKTRRRVTLEYVLLGGVNASKDDAKRLRKLALSGPFKVNLIAYNPGRAREFETVSDREIERFIRDLLPLDSTVTVRRSKGQDINAACGQLWTDTLKKQA